MHNTLPSDYELTQILKFQSDKITELECENKHLSHQMVAIKTHLEMRIDKLCGEYQSLKSQIKQVQKEKQQPQVEEQSSSKPVIPETKQETDKNVVSVSTIVEEFRDKNPKSLISKSEEQIFHFTENRAQPIMITVVKPHKHDEPSNEGSGKIWANLKAKMTNMVTKKKNKQSLDTKELNDIDE